MLIIGRLEVNIKTINITYYISIELEKPYFYQFTYITNQPNSFDVVFKTNQFLFSM